ncbi:hypothetical protein [uncultured Polaribacter sp.]|uniref:hypothetical protein n=1 Tax=uncultured Polaribacter sp. TaxID=174711 RepID=UPI0026224BE3|nr:hypothetical protein [uncultured Polaribacter sp.]
MNNLLNFKNLFLLILLVSFFTACTSNVEEELDEVDKIEVKGEDNVKDEEQEQPIAKVSFRTNVKPIIDAKCTTCHSQSGGQFPNLEGFANVKVRANRVKIRVAAGTMPQNGPLPQAQMDFIVNWVNEGALDN